LAGPPAGMASGSSRRQSQPHVKRSGSPLQAAREWMDRMQAKVRRI